MSSGNSGAADKSATEQKRRSSVPGTYSFWGLIPLENCVTAVPENLIVDLAPSLSAPASSTGATGTTSKKRSDEPSSSANISESPSSTPRAFVGAAHLDTFFIHEILTDPNREFSTKPVQSIQLPSSLQNRCVIFRAKWVSILPTKSSSHSEVGYVKILVLCTNLAAYFYNEIGTKQLLKFEYDSSQGGSSVDSMDLTKCSRTITSTKENILLGNDRGHVLIFTLELKGKGGANGSIIVHLEKSMKLCNDPIAELCAKKSGLLVVGIPSGSLAVWTGFQDEGGVKQPTKSADYVLSKPETLTGIVLWYPYAIASYGSGVLRLFNLIQKVLSAQVFAHARWISSMDLCVGAGLLLTIGEDDEARIWNLRRRQKGEQRSPIKLHSSIHIEDVNFIGGKFLSHSGTTIGVTNLGSKEVAVYSMTASRYQKRTLSK